MDWPLQTEGAGNLPLPRVRMKDLQGMPGTVGGLALRVSQLLFAVVAFTVMARTGDFPSVTAFCIVESIKGYLVWLRHYRRKTEGEWGSAGRIYFRMMRVKFE
ncbi:hypothetical protein CASFOL_022846 [Castilleja foliolosa]|uniref:Uncharacterized protein n=1 Tax=Castilleja foliolosa TaxID=1961234 RepID=A0ABD3CW64_9LAMI